MTECRQLLLDQPGAYELFPPWDLERWRQVDDTLHGGGSESVLTNWWRDSRGRHGVTFGGVLDITTLGEASFASQRFTYDPPLRLERKPLDIRLHGLRLHVHPLPLRADRPHTFTLTLKTSPLPSPDEKTRPQLTYEAHFEAPIPEGMSIPTYTVPIDILFAKFEPYCRGHKVERGDPRWQELDLRQVWEVGIMCRSGFGQQGGIFALVLFGIDVVVKRVEGKEGTHNSTEWWERLKRRVQIWRCYLARFGAWVWRTARTAEDDEKRALLSP